MAQGDSIVSISNICLVELGEDLIVDINQNVKRAIYCKQRYDDVRRGVMREHPWNCNKKQAQLAAATVPPLFGYGNAFQLPGDFLRFYKIADNDEAQWEIVGTMLYTDETAPLNIVYHYDLQDPTQFDALLTQTIGLSLAVALAVPLTQSEARGDRAAKKLQDRLDTARLISSQENSPREWDEDIWLRSRR